MKLLFALFILFVLWQLPSLRDILRVAIGIVILGLFLRHYQTIKEDLISVKEGIGIA